MPTPLGLISDASGSARFALGNTAAVAAIYGPGMDHCLLRHLIATTLGQPKYSRLERFDRATVEVEYSLGGLPQEQRNLLESRCASVVRSFVEGCVMLKAYPRQLISVRVDVERDDGSALCVALNCCTLALLDSCIQLYLTPTCISFGRTPFRDELLVDPMTAEEVASTSKILCSFGQTNELLLCESEGPLGEEELEEAVGLAVRATTVLREFMREVFARTSAHLLTTRRAANESEPEDMQT